MRPRIELYDSTLGELDITHFVQCLNRRNPNNSLTLGPEEQQKGDAFQELGTRRIDTVGLHRLYQSWDWLVFHPLNLRGERGYLITETGILKQQRYEAVQLVVTKEPKLSEEICIPTCSIMMVKREDGRIQRQDYQIGWWIPSEANLRNKIPIKWFFQQ